jgi:integrase
VRKGKHTGIPGGGRGGANRTAALKLAPAAGGDLLTAAVSEFGGQNIAIFPPSALGNSARLFLTGLSRSARRSTLARLSRFAGLFGHTVDSFPWAELSPAHVLNARGLLRETGMAPPSINLLLSHLRGVARTQRRTRPDLMSAETCAAICEVEGVRGKSEPAGRALREEEIAALRGVCARDRTAAGARDLALLSLLYYVGLRRDEACRLDPDDWSGRDHRLRVFGKGAKEEFVYVEAKEARLALGRWLKRRGRSAGPLFCSVWRGGHVRRDADGVRPLSGDDVYQLVRRRAREASLRPCTPHDLRRSAITHLLERGTDALAVQAFARHEQLSTTVRYDRRREEAKREAARQLSELKRVPPAPFKPRPRRAPRAGKRGRGGRPRIEVLELRPKPELVALARVHQCDFGERATRAELARLIREAVAEWGRGID